MLGQASNSLRRRGYSLHGWSSTGGVSTAGRGNHGVRLGGRIELGERIDPSVEGERTTQGGGVAHQVVLYGYLGW